jgi:transposase
VERIFERSAGIDVHRDTLVVTVRTRDQRSVEKTETRKFETFCDSIMSMILWLLECRVQVVGVESTGEYWKAAVQMMRQHGQGMLIWLVNPVQVKKVPGRKSDVSDSQWLSKLVMYGLVSPSYLPSAEQEDLRRLTRLRTKVVADQTRYSNRVVKYIEASGIKLASVCSDVLGKTGRRILNAILAGSTEPEALAELACGTLRSKKELLARAVQGTLSKATKFVLGELLGELDSTDRVLARIDAEIAKMLEPLSAEVELLKTVDGIDQVVAASILAECGADMSVFPSADHLASWSGLSPGSNESAGKPKSAPTRKGDKYLRTMMVQAANAAVRTKNSYWKDKFSQRVARLGHKKTIVAIGRSMLGAVYHILRDRVPYCRPDPKAPAPDKVARKLKTYTDKIRQLGYQVAFTPITPASAQIAEVPMTRA